MHNLLHRFNLDVHTKAAVLAYFTEYFEMEIVKKAREGESVEVMAQAIVQLEKAFDQLTIDLDAKPEPETPTNQAR